MVNYFLTAGVCCAFLLALSAILMGLYPSDHLGLPLPQLKIIEPIDKVLLVWEGSSSTRSAAIQLDVGSGLTVVAAASSKNHGFVQKLGASQVLGHCDKKNQGNLVAVIKGMGTKFTGTIDTIGEEPIYRM